MKKSRLLGLVAVLVLAAGGAATFAWAQTSDTTTINACVANEGGNVRIVKAGTNCRRNETATSWNTTGPVGPAGPAGAQGPAGPQGPPGSSGGGGGGSTIGTIAAVGAKQGTFAGGPFDVVGFSHEIISPRDPASGLPTGKRQHKPFVVTVPVGAGAPLFMNALVSNENLTSVTISFFKPGTNTVGTTVKLTNASVSDFGHACANVYPQCETIGFTYQKITWTWVDSGVTAEDDWEAPVS
jgi:type VI secretion system secreted protein Hcp